MPCGQGCRADRTDWPAVPIAIATMPLSVKAGDQL